MTIPITAENPVDAIKLIDFFYEPEIAASLAEYINYITPVPAAQAIIQPTRPRRPATTRRRWRQLANSPLVFPTAGRLREAALLPRLRARRPSSTQYNAIFDPIVTS